MMIVEGAGGIMVPLAERYSYLDLAEALNLPVLIVAKPGLGTINHTLLTIRVLRERGIAMIGVVINYAKNQRKGLAERTSPDVITAMSAIKVLGTVPYGSEISEKTLRAIREMDQAFCIQQKA
jgi:dethiobiotin synthetase